MKKFFLFALVFIFVFACKKEQKVDVVEIQKADSTTLNIVTFSIDPPALDPLHAFDPDSYEVISQIFDPLVYFDYDGNMQYALAISHKQLNPTTIQFKLRRGVTFHNGEEFNAASVKGTFELHADPATKSPTQGILSSIKKVDIIDDYTVNILTHFPDGMFLYRIHMFGSIVPPKFIKEKGLDHFYKNPVGTGPFKFVAWNMKKNIILEKNENYWRTGFPKLKKIIFNILKEEYWLENLLKGNIDFCMYLSGKDASLVEKNETTTVMRRRVLSSYWVLMRNQGPLANKKVRRALNMAVNRDDLIQYAEYGNGEPMASIGKKGEFGYNEDIKPYKYDIKAAKNLLKEANYEKGFKLKVLVSDISSRVAQNIKMQLQKINVDLDLIIVPRPEWAQRIPSAKMIKGKVDFDGDMTINLVDNPIYDLAFHAFIFLHTMGPFSITSNKELDKKIEWAVATSDSKEHEKRLKELDKYIYTNAYTLSTYQRILSPGINRKVNIKKINLNAHLDYNMLVEATKSE